MLTEITASNGGGFIPDAQLAEALGAYMMTRFCGQSWGLIIDESPPPGEHTGIWLYKGQAWRVTIHRWTPTTEHQFERLAFDWLGTEAQYKGRAVSSAN